MFQPQDDIDRVMAVMEQAFPPEYGEAWNRRQVSDSLLMTGTCIGLITPDGSDRPGLADDTAGFTLSRAVLDEEELLLFAIAPAYRRRGLGRLLLQRFIDKARARGIRRLFLEMRRGNPAGALYAECGFTPVGIRPRYYRTPSGERIDAISQELIIAA